MSASWHAAAWQSTGAVVEGLAISYSALSRLSWNDCWLTRTADHFCLALALVTMFSPQITTICHPSCHCWLSSLQMAQQLGSPEVHLRAVFRAVLAAASKSCSHCYVLIERFSPYLLMVMQQLPEQQQQQEDAGEQGKTGQEVLLDTLGEMYSHMPRRIDLALGRSVRWWQITPWLQLSDCRPL